MKKYLFICGCPRSGTTALCKLMNTHRQLCVSTERYYNAILNNHRLEPAMFEATRFLNYQPGESFWPRLPEGKTLVRKFADADYVGEKLPRLYERFDLLVNNFPRQETTVLFIFRDIRSVAESYTRRARNPEDKNWGRQQDWRVAVDDWNRAIAACHAYRDKINILPVNYEQLFCSDAAGGEDVVSGITRALGIADFSADAFEQMATDFFGRVEVHGTNDVLSYDEQEEVLNAAHTQDWNRIFGN